MQEGFRSSCPAEVNVWRPTSPQTDVFTSAHSFDPRALFSRSRFTHFQLTVTNKSEACLKFTALWPVKFKNGTPTRKNK